MDRSVETQATELCHVFKTSPTASGISERVRKLERSAADIKTSFPIGGKLMAKDVTLLHIAAYNGWNDVIKELVVPKHFPSAGAFLDSEKRNPLHYAACNGKKNTVNFFVKKEMWSASSTTKDNSSAMHLASYFGHLQILKFLKGCLSPGNREPLDQNDHSPLHLACISGHREIAEYLIEKLEYDYERKNARYDASPLHLAALHGHKEIVQYLIEKKTCDPNCETNEGNTPLHLACINGHIKVVEYLLDRKDVHAFVFNKYFITPDEYAFSKEDILKMFRAKSKLQQRKRKRGKQDNHFSFRTGDPPPKEEPAPKSQKIEQKEFDLNTALMLLKKNDFTDAFLLGVNLDIRQSQLRQLHGNHGVDELYQVLEYWFRQKDPQSPWQELADAVRSCDNHRTALAIEKEAAKSGYPLIKALEKDMKLEANDRQFPYYVCMATIKDKKGDEVTIHFDGWSDDYDYTCSVDSVELHPVGWCKEHFWRLDKPSSSSLTDSEWKSHPDGADKSYFHKNQLEGQHCLCFSKDMIVEVSDKPDIASARIAVVTDIQDEYIKLHFKEFGSHRFSDNDTWYPQYSAKIHPPKWCHRHGGAIELPLPGDQPFYWGQFIKDNPHLIPAPAHIFLEGQW